MTNPWENCKQSWGPGTLEDYAKLSGQRNADAVEIFNIFICRNVDTKMHGHLLDNDENDGQFVRDAIYQLQDTLERVQALATRLLNSEQWDGTPALISRSFGEMLQKTINKQEEQ